MKIGFCLNMTSRRQDGTGLENLQQLSELGYDYAELPLVEMLKLDERDLSRVPDNLVKLGIPCLSCNNLFPAEIRLTGPEVDMSHILEHSVKALSLAKSMGANIVVFGSGVARNVPEGFPLQKALEQLIHILTVVDDVADKYGIRLVLEAACRQATNIINNYEEACRWLNDSGATHAGVMLDLFHELTEDPTQASLKAIQTCPEHIHIACPVDSHGRLRSVPRLNDGFDYSVFLKKLDELSYSGLVSVEAYVEDFRKDATDSINYLRSCWPIERENNYEDII